MNRESDEDGFWRDVLAAKRQAEAEDARELAAARELLAPLDGATEPMPEARIEALVQTAMAHGDREAEVAAVRQRASRWLSGSWRAMVAAAVIATAHQLVVAGSDDSTAVFSNVVLRDSTRQLSLQSAVRVLVEPRQTIASRRSATGVISGYVTAADRVLGEMLKEAPPIADAARRACEALRGTIAEPGGYRPRFFGAAARDLLLTAQDAAEPAADRIQALEQVTPMLAHAIEALTVVHRSSHPPELDPLLSLSFTRLQALFLSE